MMKKTLALILCLVLCAFCFASCGKKKGTADTTTANGTAAPTTTAGGTVTPTEPEETEPEETEPECVHTPEADYVIESEPTCVTPGEKVLYCEQCGAELERVPIPVDPNAHKVEEWTITKESTLFTGDGTMEGTCVYCQTKLEKTYSATVERKYTTEPIADSERLFVEQNIYSELLNGGEIHFYPTDDDPAGNDLYVEFSFLWNNTFDNLGGQSVSGGHPIIDTRLDTAARDKGKGNDLTWMSLKDNASGSDCTFAGGFEYGSLRTVEVGPAGMSTRTAGGPGNTYADFPNIGGADRDNPEWGWHRYGVKFHQELTNEDALKADTEAGATAATYYFFVETYIDGVLVSRLSNTPSPDFGGSTAFKDDKGNNQLFTATSDGQGGITYEDIPEGCHIMGLRAPFFNTEKDVAYLVYADYYATAGDGFVQNVSRVASPVAATYTTADGVELNGTFYYQLSE